MKGASPASSRHVIAPSPTRDRPAASASPPVQTARPLWWAIGLVLLTFLVYAPALRGPFFMDDELLLSGNPLVAAADGLRWIWASTETIDYFPLTLTSYWLEWRLWGAHPVGYHVTNVLLHATSALLFWRLLQRLHLRAPWFGAALFALHPVNVASVAWIAERKNTLSMPLLLTSALLFLAFERRQEARPARAVYLASLATFVLSLLAKSSGVIFPIWLLLAVWWQRGRIGRQDLLRLLPFFAASLLLGAVTLWFHHHRALQGTAARADDLLTRTAIAGQAVWFYASKAVVPVGLTFFYPRWRWADASTAIGLIPLAALILLFVGCWRGRATWGRAPLVGGGAFVIALGPVLGFVDISWMRFALVADHWAYLASLAACASLAAAGAAASHRLSHRGETALATGALIILGVLAAGRARLYGDPEALWRQNVAQAPGSWGPHEKLADWMARQGQFDEAETLFRQAQRLAPGAILPSLQLAKLQAARGDRGAALGTLDQAIGRVPDDAGARLQRARVLMQATRTAEAEAEYRTALRLQPRMADARIDLIRLLTRQRRFDEAMAEARAALQAGGEPSGVRSLMGLVLLERGDLAGARRELEEAVRLRPARPEPHHLLGVICARQGDKAAARAAFLRALELRPGWDQPQAALRALGG